MTSSSPSRTYGGKTIATRRAERRTAFLDAGLHIFGGKGFANSSVTDICATAGLARSQFYAEFDDRESLLIEVYEHIQRQLHGAVIDALAELPATAEVAERAEAVITALLGVLASNPHRAQVCYVEMQGVSARVDEYRAQRRREWVEFFEATIRKHSGDGYRPPGGYALAASGFLGALTEVSLQWLRTEPRPPIDDVLAVMTAILGPLMLASRSSK